MNKAEFIAAQRTEHVCVSRSLMGEHWECRNQCFTSSAAVGLRRPGSAEPTSTARSRTVSLLLAAPCGSPREYALSCAKTALAVSKKTVEASMARPFPRLYCAESVSRFRRRPWRRRWRALSPAFIARRASAGFEEDRGGVDGAPGSAGPRP